MLYKISLIKQRYAPFEDDADKKVTMFEKIKKAKYTFNPKYWNSVSEQAKDLIRNLLVVDPAKRLTAEQSLSHPWIADHLSELAPQSTAEDPDTKPEPTPVITPKNDTPKNDKTSSHTSDTTNSTVSKSESSSTTPSKATSEPETRTTPLSARRKRKAVPATEGQEANGNQAKKMKEEKEDKDNESKENGEKEDSNEDKEDKAAKTKKVATQKKGRGRPKSK